MNQAVSSSQNASESKHVPAIIIRPARVEEAATLVDFQLRMASETEQLALHRPTVEQGVAELFRNPQRGQYWVALVDGAIAGCMLIQQEWSDWRNGSVLWIHSVYVEPAMRKRGIFTAMYHHLQQQVQSDPNLKGLRLFVDRTNVNAQRRYQALGMSDDHYRLFEWLKP